MPKILYPKLTGRLSSVADKFPPVSDDHLHCAIHEAGHYAATLPYYYSRFSRCIVREMARKEFRGGQFSSWQVGRDTDKFEYFEGLTLQALGCAGAVLSVQQVHGVKGADIGTILETKAAVEGFMKFATPAQYTEMIGKLADTFKTPSIPFQQAFARMLIPSIVGRWGTKPCAERGVKKFYGAENPDSWHEWRDHLDDCDVSYCSTWAQFVAEWKIPPVPAPAPIKRENLLAVMEHYRRLTAEDIMFSCIENNHPPCPK